MEITGNYENFSGIFDCLFIAQKLAWTKYQISIPKEEVAACHRVGDHGIIISFLNRKEGSAYKRLLNPLKSGVLPCVFTDI